MRQRLGQHFLRSEKALAQIIEAADLDSTDTVLEIGPGKGVLTEALLARAARVIAVEKDPALVKMIKEKFDKEIQEARFKIHEGDIRDTTILESIFLKLASRHYKVVANIPYYITGELLRTFLSAEHQPERIVFLIQKEVAERIACLRRGRGRQARSKKESILSISVKIYGDPKYIATVPKGAFSPAPEVDSAILLVERISRGKLKNIDEGRFFELVRAGFASKRKFLARNLEKVAARTEIRGAFEQAGLDEKVRAEDVSLEQWLQLTQKLSQNF